MGAPEGEGSETGLSERPPGAILFMCGQNVIRSPMAEAIARQILPSSIYVASAGVRRGEPDPFVDAVLDEIGLSSAGHHPKTLEDLEDDYFDLIITLAPEAHHVALDLTRSMAVDVIYWPTPDPTSTTGTREQIMTAYRDVRNHLKSLIELRLAARFGAKGDVGD